MNPKTILPRAIRAKFETGQWHRRPLVCMNAAQADLDMSTAEVLALLDQGLLIGFDIAARLGRRREIRLLVKAIELILAKHGTEYPARAWPGIVAAILPGEKIFIPGTAIQSALNCDRGHVENLIARGQLVCGKKSSPGPNGSPHVTRASLETFLRSRML